MSNGKKKIAIIGATHGDERVGMRVIEKLGTLIDHYKIEGIIANKKALEKRIRFIDKDLNRSFPGKKKGNHEERLAFNLARKMRGFDYVLDLHSFSCRSDPFVILTKKSRTHLKMATASGINKVVFMSPKLASGRSLIDYCRHGISIETGRHNSRSTFERASGYTRNILRALGFLDGGRTKASRVDYFEVVDIFFKKADEKLTKNVVNFKLIRRGEIYAMDGQVRLLAPYDFYPVLARENAYPKILFLVAKRVKMERR